MDIEKIIEFIQVETKENEKLLYETYKSIKNLLTVELNTINQKVQGLLLNKEYDKVNLYVETSKMVSDTYDVIQELAHKYSLDNLDVESDNEVDKNETIEDSWVFLEEDKKINYDDYRVDENIAYDLLTDFCHMKPAAFSLDGIRYPARLWKIVLVQTCELLWMKNADIFESFIDDKFMQGKTRIYFSKDKKNMTKPELINGTGIYIETNLSANNIRDVIVKMLDKYRIPLISYKIYLSKDLNPLHTSKELLEEVVDNCDEKKAEDQFIENLEIFDMQDYCADFDCKTQQCMNENSPYFIMQCCNKKNCEYRRKKPIHVVLKETLKKGLCPECWSHLEQTMFPVEIRDLKGIRQKKLIGQWCDRCKTAYIDDDLFYRFTLNKDLNNINVTFQVEKDLVLKN